MSKKPQDLRSQLQEIALELYRERGYESVTSAEIAARAGVTERTFFRYFADKREVLFQEDPRLRPALIAAAAQAPGSNGPLDVVIRALRSLVGMFEENRSFTEPRREIIAANPSLRERAEAKTASLILLLAGELEKRDVEASLALLAARVGMAAFGYAAQSWFADPSRSLDSHLEKALQALDDLAVDFREGLTRHFH